MEPWATHVGVDDEGFGAGHGHDDGHVHGDGGFTFSGSGAGDQDSLKGLVSRHEQEAGANRAAGLCKGGFGVFVEVELWELVPRGSGALFGFDGGEPAQVGSV